MTIEDISASVFSVMVEGARQAALSWFSVGDNPWKVPQGCAALDLRVMYKRL